MKTCIIEGCENKHHSLGYCRKHYERFKVYGSPLIVKNIIGEDRINNPLYSIYNGMKSRCLKPNHKLFKHYGDRGITICERWLGLNGFTNFCEDMGERPTKNHSIDRKDNDKGYSKDNCRWATKSEQALNRRTTKKHPYVFFQKFSQKWVIQKSIDSKIKYFGLYPTHAEAVEATIKLGFITK